MSVTSVKPSWFADHSSLNNMHLMHCSFLSGTDILPPWWPLSIHRYTGSYQGSGPPAGSSTRGNRKGDMLQKLKYLLVENENVLSHCSLFEHVVTHGVWPFQELRADERLGKTHISQHALITAAYMRRAVGVSQLFSSESWDFWAFSLTQRAGFGRGGCLLSLASSLVN